MSHILPKVSCGLTSQSSILQLCQDGRTLTQPETDNTSATEAPEHQFSGPQPICVKIIPLYLGPVVQSIISLKSSFRGQLLSVLGLHDQIHCYFLLKKCKKLLHCKSFSHFFNKKYWQI